MSSEEEVVLPPQTTQPNSVSIVTGAPAGPDRRPHAVENRPFYASLWSSTISGKNIARLSNVGFL